MPLHLSSRKKWDILLKAIANPTIEVTNVDDKTIVFKANKDDITNLRSLFANPDI